MMSVSISGIPGRSNPYHLFILNVFGWYPCHGGELGGLCQLPGHLIAHQHGIGARPLRAFAVALRVPYSELFVSRRLFSKLIQSLFPGLIVLMRNAPPRAAGTQ